MLTTLWLRVDDYVATMVTEERDKISNGNWSISMSCMASLAAYRATHCWTDFEKLPNRCILVHQVGV